ncbi:MAG TPA: multicopper oxidase domain-containing protein [Flavisolibacter sp.]
MDQKILRFSAILQLVMMVFAINARAQSLLAPRSQQKFINQLPVPPVLDATSGGTHTIDITQFSKWLGLKDPVTQAPLQTTVWGYNGHYPGPTIVAMKNVPVQVFWRNKLLNASNQPLPHLLPIDGSVHWALEAETPGQQHGVPIVTHLHGGHTESASDGLPDAWYTPDFMKKGNGFIKGDITPYYYHNDQEAATIWYHDHALGITRLNVYAGLAGFYLVTDPNEIQLRNTGKLPAAPYDLGLAIQDRMFTVNGQLFYPSAPAIPGTPAPGVMPEFFGDFILVNGMAWPVLDVEPRKYRFRMLNGSDSRFYNLFLSSGQPIVQIGTDNGFLQVPVTMHQLLIGPGERKDVIIDFSHPSLAGKTIIMRNNAKTPFPKGEPADPATTGQIMAFRVVQPMNQQVADIQLPATLRPAIVPLQPNAPARQLVLFEGEDEYGRLKPMLGTVADGAMPYHHPITENPMTNDIEVWEIFNATEDAHPIHLHMVSMQLVNRQKFHADIEEDGSLEDIRFSGQPRLAAADEKGWKDTWVMFPGEVTRVIAKFDLEGLYVWHCHILSHEDHEMMRPYYVGQLNNFSVHMQRQMPGIANRSMMLQVTPNPTRGMVRIHVDAVATGPVSIRIRSMSGAFVREIFNGKMEAGTHIFEWNAASLPAGVYFVEAAGERQHLVNKLILQR